MFTRVVQKYTFVSKSRELFKFMKNFTQKNSARLVENWLRESTLNFWGCQTRKTNKQTNFLIWQRITHALPLKMFRIAVALHS